MTNGVRTMIDVHENLTTVIQGNPYLSVLVSTIAGMVIQYLTKLTYRVTIGRPRPRKLTREELDQQMPEPASLFLHSLKHEEWEWGRYANNTAKKDEITCGKITIRFGTTESMAAMGDFAVKPSYEYDSYCLNHLMSKEDRERLNDLTIDIVDKLFKRDEKRATAEKEANDKAVLARFQAHHRPIECTGRTSSAPKLGTPRLALDYPENERDNDCNSY